MERSTAMAAGAGVALLGAAVHLGIELASGGVVSHHPLADPALPAISNWFGLLTLPVLGALAGLRLADYGVRAFLLGFLPALLYGAALAVAWEVGADDVAQRLFLGVFLVASFLPVHRAESLAGFVAGMTFTFGGVLPVFIGGVVMTASMVLACVRRGLFALLRRGDAAAG